MGGDSPDGRSHAGVLRDHHLEERSGEDGRLVDVLHRHLDEGQVAERAGAEEVGVDVSVGRLDSKGKTALCLEVQRLATEKQRPFYKTKNVYLYSLTMWQAFQMCSKRGHLDIIKP